MRNKYTDEQRQTIIDRYISSGETYSQINADIGIAKSTFYSWLKQYNIEKETAKKKQGAIFP
jgi:transposase-like protein